MASLGLFNWTFSLFIPIWKPFIAWIAAWALAGLSKETKPRYDKKMELVMIIDFIWWLKLILILTKTFTLICSAIDKYFRTNNRAKWHKHLHQFTIAKFLRQMINKQVTAFRSRYGASCEKLISKKRKFSMCNFVSFFWYFFSCN